MSSYVRQTNFLAGELSPLLWGRTDLPVFGKGARTMRNFFPSLHGAAVSRPGTFFIGLAKSAAGTRLIPFIYSDSQSYVLEFTAGWLNVWSNQQFVVGLISPYGSADLAQLQYAQVGDVMTITHPSYDPRELARTGAATFVFSTVSFERPAPNFVPKLNEPYPAQDATHPAREWDYLVTELRRDARGIVTESLPAAVKLGVSGVPVPATFAIGNGNGVVVHVFLNVGQTVLDANRVGFNVYRGRGGLHGLVGTIASGGLTFSDYGDAPDYSTQPPQGLNPFKVLNTDGTTLRIEKPSAVGFYEGRRWFGGTTERPGFLFGSAVEDYANFDTSFLPTADQAVVLELACMRREEVRSITGINRLIAGTNASIWAVGGDTGPMAITPTNVTARVQDNVGSNRLPAPLVVNGALLFSRAKGAGVRSLVYDFSRGGYSTTDLSNIAQHLFVNQVPSVYAWSSQPLVDWCFQEDPWALVWGVRADGTLISLTYAAGGDLWGWARHDLPGGTVLSICSVPEGQEDAVYLAVERLIGGVQPVCCIERFATRAHQPGLTTTQFDHITVDCAVKVEVNPPVALLNLNGLPGAAVLEGQKVWVISEGNVPYGPLPVVGGFVTLPEAPLANQPGGGTDWIGFVGLLFTPELETLDLAQESVRGKMKTVVRVGFEVDESRGLQVGQDFDHLEEWQQRDVTAGYGPVGAATDLFMMPVDGTWNEGGRAVLRQTLPLPVTVLGLTREVDIGGP